MSEVKGKVNLSGDESVVDKNTITDRLRDVTKNLDNFLIDNNAKKDWGHDEIQESPIPRPKNRGDRLSSSLLNNDDLNHAVSSENIVKNDVRDNVKNKENHEINEYESEDEELTLDLDEPSSPEILEYARSELGETDEVKCQTLQELREMIYERGECTPHRMDDAFLVRFLRARNFNVNRAHRLIVRYCDFKEEHPDIHQGVNPLKMRHIGDDDAMTVPGYRTKCGRRMMIYRIGNWDPKKYGIEELFKATVIILELGILEPVAQMLGGVVIFDLEGITMAHAWTITPQVASMVMALMVSAFPMKTHAIHILHQSWIFDVIFAMFRPLLDSNMQNRIFFHGEDMSGLHERVGINNLPKKYGGTHEELKYYKWIDSLSKKPKIVKEMYELGYVVPDEILKTIQDII